MTSVPWSWHWR